MWCLRKFLLILKSFFMVLVIRPLCGVLVSGQEHMSHTLVTTCWNKVFLVDFIFLVVILFFYNLLISRIEVRVYARLFEIKIKYHRSCFKHSIVCSKLFFQIQNLIALDKHRNDRVYYLEN